MPGMELAGKVALVTGAAVRVGRAIALELARSGCDLVVHYHRSGQQAEQTAADIRALGRRAISIQADLAEPASACQQLLSAVEAEYPRLDILVNNAAIYLPGSPADLPPDQWARMVAVNLTAPTMLAERAGAMMAAAQPCRGAIINILDIQARRPWPRYLGYGLTKGGLWSATAGLARRLAPAVRVNGVAPGIVLWNDREADPDWRARLIDAIPMKRTGRPEDVAHAVRFLAEADYIAGQVICVDGGRSM